MLRSLAVIALVCAATLARADRVVAVAPLSTLGAEDKSAAGRQLIGEIERAFGALAGTKVIPAATVGDAIAKAKRPQLRACENDAACRAEIGRLVGAQVVIAGEVGGLGASQIVYLSATDVATGKEMRSTTLSLGDKADTTGGASGAAVRLLDPDKFRGTVHFAIDVSGATVFVNGTKATLQNGTLVLPVGAQAIRVTHPQYHDFVRFVDVGYGRTTEVAVGMQQYPIIEHDVRAKPTGRDRIVRDDPPVWRRWYVAGPAIVVLGVGAALVVGAIAHKFPFGSCRKVGEPMPTACN
jgi:hypothetical protein